MLSGWQEIPVAAGIHSLNVRRADPDHPLDFRIGRDFRGRYAFQLDALAPVDTRPAPTSAGIEVTLDPLENGHCRLTMVLAHTDDFDIFRVLCVDLLAVTRNLAPEDDAKGMSLALKRVTRWQEVLARRRAGALSRQAIMGLFGELMFLRDQLLSRVSAGAAVAAWQGPFGHEQDFAIGKCLLEVKTQSSTADRRIRISSEDQLDPGLNRLILCQQGVAPALPDDPSGRTLNELVTEIRNTVEAADLDAVDRLDLALLAMGWEVRAEYDQDRWVLADRFFYEVTDGFPRIACHDLGSGVHDVRAIYKVGERFPRIVRDDLPSGVEDVRYRIRTAACAPFQIDIENTMQELITQWT